MKIGVPKEIKPQENRVGLTPASVADCALAGHSVLVETNAGAGIGASDDAYRAAGATVVDSAAQVFADAELIVKVKEPQPSEWVRLRPHHTLFTYLHLAADPAQARGLMESGCTAIAYETVTSPRGGLPLLAPMSEIAGRMAPIMAATHLAKHMGGLGRLLCGVPGVESANVLVLGGGVAGFNAARVAVGMGANVTILEKSPDRIRFLDEFFGPSARVVASSRDAAIRYLPAADAVIGAVLIPGASAPKLITRSDLETMKTGAVIVDIAIDQGGCAETSHPTKHESPTFTVDGVIHYCVANMPGAFPQTSTAALNNATLPFVLALATKGTARALADDLHLANGLNIAGGKVVNQTVATALGL